MWRVSSNPRVFEFMILVQDVDSLRYYNISFSTFQVLDMDPEQKSIELEEWEEEKEHFEEEPLEEEPQEEEPWKEEEPPETKPLEEELLKEEPGEGWVPRALSDVEDEVEQVELVPEQMQNRC